MISYVLLSAVLVLSIDAQDTLLQVYGSKPQKCSSFVCDEETGKCNNDEFECDLKPPCVNGNAQINDRCRPRCCDNAVVLDFNSFGVKFSAHIESDLYSTSKTCQRLVDGVSVSSAFLQSIPKLTTTCTDFRIVIEIQTDADTPLFSVCGLRFQTVKLTSTVVTVAGNAPRQYIKSNVAVVINELGNFITLAFKSTKIGGPVCTFDVKNIEIVVCPQLPATTTVSPTTVLATTLQPVRRCNLTTVAVRPSALVDRDGNPCKPLITTQPLSVSTCSGQCQSSTSGLTQFSDDASCIPPTVLFKSKDCRCCDGNGAWATYPIRCDFRNNGSSYDTFFSIFQMNTCDCSPCLFY